MGVDPHGTGRGDTSPIFRLGTLPWMSPSQYLVSDSSNLETFHSYKFWSVNFQERHWNCCHQMSYFKAKMHQTRFQPELHHRSHWGSLQHSPDSQLDLKGLLLRWGRVKKSKGKRRKRRGKRGKEKRKGGEYLPWSLVFPGFKVSKLHSMSPTMKRDRCMFH